MSVRRAHSWEAAALAALHQRIFPEPWGQDFWATALADDGIRVWCVGDGRLMAMAALRIVLDEAEVLTLGVAPDARREGFARDLLRAAMAEVYADGVAEVFLEVAATNHPAYALYEQFGFKTISERKAYYADGDTALVMRWRDGRVPD